MEFEGKSNQGKGLNFTEDIEYAKQYGKYIYPVKLNISKWVTTDKEAKTNSTYGINDIDEIVVYHSEQVAILKSEEEHPITQEAANQLIEDLTKRLGVKAIFTTKDKLEGQVAAYKDGVVHLTRLDLDDTIHEFVHPFIDALVNKNQEVFFNTVREIVLDHPDIYEQVQKLYKDESELMQYKEMAVRAITLLAKGNINETTGKANPIITLWNYIKDLIKDIFGLDKLNLSTLSPNTTLKQLADLVSTYEGEINLGEQEVEGEYQFKKTEEQIN